MEPSSSQSSLPSVEQNLWSLRSVGPRTLSVGQLHQTLAETASQLVKFAASQ